MGKSADAFRTISEVADWLGVPAHVLRFWESKFTQVKPVKRAGGRRYYRPADMKLLGGIRKLLHDDGMTIKGVQKVLRDQGVRHVAGLSHPVDDIVGDEDISLDVVTEAGADGGTVVRFQRDPPGPGDVRDSNVAQPEQAPASDAGTVSPEPPAREDDAPAAGAPSKPADVESDGSPQGTDPVMDPTAPEDPVTTSPQTDTVPDGDGMADRPDMTPPEDTAREPEKDAAKRHDDQDESRLDDAVRPPVSEETSAASDTPAPDSPPAEESASAPKPVDTGEDPPDDAPAAPGLLSGLALIERPLAPETATRLTAVRDRLKALRDKAAPQDGA